ncbi:MAG: tyrosine-type recombinase/integrase [Acidimicrobiales bacterium]
MSAVHLVAGTARAVNAGADDPSWLEWLVAHVDVAWRRAEWDHEHFLFTGDLDNDRTVAWRCRTPSCPAVTRRHHGRCDSCRRAQSESGIPDEAFDRQPRRTPFFPLVRAACAVNACGREASSHGLCVAHGRAFRARDVGVSLEEFVAKATPLRPLYPCLVLVCPRQRTSERGLCAFHANRLRRELGNGLLAPEVGTWAKRQPPRLGPHQFSLAGLHETVRYELLYCLQQRDELPPPLDPMQVRIVVTRLLGAASIRELDLAALCQSGGMQYNAAAKGLVRHLARHLTRAWSRFSGADPYAGDRWEVGPLGLFPNGSRRYPATEGVVDFGPIGEPWLREVAKAWARTTRPYLQNLRQAIKACALASTVLTASGSGDPALLGAGEFTRVIEALSLHGRDDGSLYSASFRNVLLSRFREVVDSGRADGLMAEVPDAFSSARRTRVVSEANEDEIGKALPETVIHQLDAHLHLLGPSGRMGPVAARDLQAMHQTIYRILRDTGRRPGEVASLLVDCVEVIDGHHNLVYDNHKAGRLRRRLPITTDTAEAIGSWEHRRRSLPMPPSGAKWLFPSPLLRATRSAGHLTAAGIGAEFRAWVRKIGTIEGEVLGGDGRPAAFDRARLIPYALRHSYAQRHADAGVPVDVLRELLDHVSVQTTMGYYSNPRELHETQEKALVA